jgi:hypothetical protein
VDTGKHGNGCQEPIRYIHYTNMANTSWLFVSFGESGLDRAFQRAAVSPAILPSMSSHR